MPMDDKSLYLESGRRDRAACDGDAACMRAAPGLLNVVGLSEWDPLKLRSCVMGVCGCWVRATVDGSEHCADPCQWRARERNRASCSGSRRILWCPEHVLRALKGGARRVISAGNTVLRQLLMGELPLVHASGVRVCGASVAVARTE
jgi:hypothetical protein